MNISKVLAVLIVGVVSLSTVAESTIYSKIGRLKVDGPTGYIYFQSEVESWGAPSCSAGAYAYVNPNENSSAKDILSVGLAAKLAERRVLFDGVCDASGYLKINNIWLE